MLPSPSIILEWETGLHCPGERLHASMEALAGQLRELAPSFREPPETIICHDPAQAPEAGIRATLAGALGGGPWPGNLQVVAVPPGLRYYQKKVHGFTLSSREIILLLDSDLIVEAGWLKAMVEPFADFHRTVVVGRTHLDTGTRFERAVALSWIFDAREEASALRPTTRLVSNNIAFRRALFARLPFPELPTFRVACSDLGRTLGSAGIVMYEHTGARASHPPPRGRFFLERAILAGTDQHFVHAREGGAGPGRCFRQWRTDLGNVARRIRERRAPVGAAALDVLAARCAGLAFYSLKAAGYLGACLR